MNHYLLHSLQAHHASPHTGILQAVAHLPLLAFKHLLHYDHHLCTYPCAFLVNALVLTTGAAALHFHAIGVPHTRNSYLLHNLQSIMFNGPLGFAAFTKALAD